MNAERVNVSLPLCHGLALAPSYPAPYAYSFQLPFCGCLSKRPSLDAASSQGASPSVSGGAPVTGGTAFPDSGLDTRSKNAAAARLSVAIRHV
jgi:hypothetical protein